jgi:hypothetical protein
MSAILTALKSEFQGELGGAVKQRFSGGRPVTGEQIVTRARDEKAAFGIKCSKFAGAVTVEILRAALTDEGIPVSPRDVFVRGIPVEIDLVVPRPKQEPLWGLLYEPGQVAAALEIKNTGTFGENSLAKIRRDFGHFREAGISCAYVTLEERRSYRWAASTEVLGFSCFTLAWHAFTGGPIEPTEAWVELVKFLRKCIEA